MSRFQLDVIIPTHPSHSSASCKLRRLLRNSSVHPICDANFAGPVELSWILFTSVHRTFHPWSFEKYSTVSASSVLKNIWRLSPLLLLNNCSAFFKYVSSLASRLSIHLSPCRTCTEIVPSLISSLLKISVLRRSSSRRVRSFGRTTYAVP